MISIAIEFAVAAAVPRPTPALAALGESGAVLPVLTFNSPEHYPNLYRVDSRFDGLHLNASGAREFSRHFAERLVERLEQPATR